jgi:hypothetical protein
MYCRAISQRSSPPLAVLLAADVSLHCQRAHTLAAQLASHCLRLGQVNVNNSNSGTSLTQGVRPGTTNALASACEQCGINMQTIGCAVAAASQTVLCEQWLTQPALAVHRSSMSVTCDCMSTAPSRDVHQWWVPSSRKAVGKD